MNTYIQTNGVKHICRFMLAPTLKPNHYWLNISKLGSGKNVFVETEYKVTK